MIKKLYFVIFLLTFIVFPTPAQSTPEQAITNAQDQFFDIKKRSVELERMKREANKPTADKDLSSKFPKIKEDFEELQKISNKIFQFTKAQTPLNYPDLLDWVTEINHRAARLNSNLFSDEPKDKNHKTSTTGENLDLKELLGKLDKAIFRFAHNPIFQNLKLVNTNDSLKAQRDLENIISVSAAIKEMIKN